MKERTRQWAWVFGLFLIFAALSGTTFWDVMTNPDQVLAFNDANIEPLFSPSYGFPQALARIWDNQFFFGQGQGQAGLTVTALGETVFGPHHYRKDGQAVILALCGLAFYWLFRQYRFGRPASSLAAAILILTGWCNTFALSGLPVRPIALAFTALSLGFVERGRQNRGWIAYAAGGGCLGLAISEVPDVGALLAIASAFVFAWTHLADGSKAGSFIAGRWSVVLKFALFIIFSALLGWQTITGIVGTQIQGVKQGTEESPEARFAWATQWSVPPQETWNIVSGSYFGASMRSDTYPYWGRSGRSEGWEKTRQGFRNFTMTGYHVGVVASILLIALFIYMFRTKRDSHKSDEDAAAYPLAYPKAFSLMIFLGSMGSLMLLWGKYFPLYRLFWSLPYISTFRNPEKWNGPFLLFAIIGIAFMLDLIWRHLESAKATDNQDPKTKNSDILRSSLLWSALSLAGIALVILLGTSAAKDSFIERLTAEGYGALAGVAYDNAIAACLKVLVIGGIFAGLIAFCVKRQTLNTKQKKDNKPSLPSPSPNSYLSSRITLFAILAILAIGDLYLDNRPYVTGHTYKHFLQPNPLTDFLDAHKTEGRIKLLPPQHPLLNNLRLTLFEVKGYDLFEPISVSRMPTDYEALFKALERQPARLWEIGSLRYFITLPGGLEQLNKADGNRSRFVERLALGVGVVDGSYIPMSTENPSQRYLRVVEFTGALPKYRLVGKVTQFPSTQDGLEQALNRLGAPDFPPATEATLQSTNLTISIHPPVRSSVKIIADSSLDSHLEVESDQPCLLVRSVKYDQNWRASVDGHPAEIQCADYLLQGVLVPAGTHAITFSYQPSLKSQVQSLTVRLVLAVIVMICLILHPPTPEHLYP